MLALPAAAALPRSLRQTRRPGRSSARCRVPRAQASAGESFEFEGALLQEVRAGQSGFATRLQVHQGAARRGAEGAQEGDTVSVTYATVVDGGDGAAVTELVPPEEPLTFEVGASSALGNPLFQAFDRAVRGLRVGDTAVVQAQGGEYDKELLFAVPRSHPEIARLEDAAATAGGLKEGQVVQLANGNAAVLRRVDDQGVLLDCNHPLAGAPLKFTLTVVGLERAKETGDEGLP